MNFLSNKAKVYPASGIRKMFDLAEKYENVIKLTVGEPNFDTPVNIKEATKLSIDRGDTYYSPNAGIKELREAIANKYKNYFEGYTYKNVMITIGAMEAFILSLLTTIDPGDEVILPDPYYPNYIGALLLTGAKPIRVPVYEENNFNIRAEDIKKHITSKTKGIVINSPSNPLGSVLSKEEIIKISKIVEENDLLVYSDEVYDKLIYDNIDYFSMAQIPAVRENTLVINSFSKTYAMTGWRIGYIVGDEKIISNMPKIQEGIISCVPTFIQYGAIEALEGDQKPVEDMIKHYSRRRDILVNGLNEIPGIKCKKPSGSFYAFANIKSFNKTSQEFAEELLEETGVVVVPGSAFGDMGEGYIRLVFANSDENLKEAIERIKNYINQNY